MPGKVDIQIGGKVSPALLGDLNRLMGRFGSLQSQVLGLLPGLTSLFTLTGLAHFARQTIDAADAMGKMAQRTGLAVEKMSALTYAAKLNEVEQGELEAGLRRFMLRLAETGKGTADVEEELFKFADRMQQTTGAAQRMALSQEYLARGSRNMVSWLAQGSAAMRDAMEEGRRLGAVIGADFTSQADEFNDNIFRMTTLAKGFANTILSDVLPAVNNLAQLVGGQDLGKVSKWFADYLMSNVQLFGMWRMLNLGATLVRGKPPAAAPPPEGGGGMTDEQRIQKLTTEIAYRKLIHESQSKDSKGYVEAVEKEIAAINALAQAYADELEIEEFAASQEDVPSIEGRLKRAELINKTLAAQNEAQKLQAGLEEKPGEPQVAERIKSEFEKNDLRFQLKAMLDEFPTLAQSTAQTFRTVFTGAIDAIAQGISGLIQGTLTWGNALRQIGAGIMNSIIGAISKMFAEWIAQRIFISGLEVMLGMKELAAWGPVALIKSIASMGTAALVGTIAFIAALGIGMAALSGAFAEGGYTGAGGKQDVAGLVHRGEFVMPAESVNRLGLPMLEALRAGQSPPAAGGGMAVGIFDDRSKMRDWFETQEGQAVILDIVGKHRHEFI